MTDLTKVFKRCVECGAALVPTGKRGRPAVKCTDCKAKGTK